MLSYGARRAFDLLASGRLAIVLLAFLSVLLAVYLAVPQRSQLEPEQIAGWLAASGLQGRVLDALGLTDVRGSTWLYGAVALMFTNLLLCMSRRLRPALRQARFPERPPRSTAGWLERRIEAPAGLDAARAAAVLEHRGYRTLRSGGVVYGLRGRFAFLGHWLFHVALLVLLAGGGYVAATPDAFNGTIGIGEGEAFDLHRAPFLGTNLPVTDALPALRFELERIDVVLAGRDVRQLDLRVAERAGRRVTMGINHPYRNAPYQIMVDGFGYMPGWAVVDARGRVLAGSWVKLVPFPLQAEDSFPIGPGESVVHVRLLPDHERAGTVDRTRSLELRNPRFEARIVWQGGPVFQGLLEPGERVALGDGREFFFLTEIRRWGLVRVIHERGQWIVFAGLGLAVLGLAVRYIRTRKEVLVEVGPGTLTLRGRSEMLENLFAEELERLGRELADGGDVLAARGGPI